MTGIPGASREVQPSCAPMRANCVPMERRETSDEGDTNRFPHETDTSATVMPDSKRLEVSKDHYYDWTLVTGGDPQDRPKKQN